MKKLKEISFFILVFSFLLVYPFYFSKGQDSFTEELVRDQDSIQSDSVLSAEKDNTSVSDESSHSPFYAKWWFSLIVVSAIVPMLIVNIRKRRTYGMSRVAELQNEINSLNELISQKDAELIKIQAEKKEDTSVEREFLYQSEGISRLNDILSKNKNNSAVLGQKIISEIVGYTGANSGVVYILKEDDTEPYLGFLGGFAPSPEQIAAKFRIGEGYIGTCYKEGTTMDLSNIPENYIKVLSGLGESKPAYIYFIPLIQDEIKLGVIEIASFKKLGEYKIKMIEKFSESFASSLALSKANEKMQHMLDQSQKQASELQEQEERLRQNLEEMEATQEELQRKAEENERMQKELAKETALLNALLVNIPEHIYFKDLESKFIKHSMSMSRLFGFDKMDALLGKSDFDFFDEEHARPAYEDEQKIIKTGKPVVDLVEKEVKKDGSVSFVSTTKMPLKDIHGKTIGTFGISKDITRQKKTELEIQEKNEVLLAQEEELRQNLEEMQATQEELERQITENKKIQEELKKEKYLMDALMNNIPDAIYFKDKESKFLKTSMSMAKMFHLNDPGELVGKSDFDFFDDEHAMPAYEGEQKIIKTGKAVVNLVEKEVKKDGSVTWASTTKMPLKDHKGKIIGTFGISKDVTEVKKMEQEMQQKNEELLAQEEELRQNLEEMQATQEDLERQIENNKKTQQELEKETYLMNALLYNVPEFIYFKDLESRFIKNSLSMSKLFGFEDINAILGKSDFDFFDDEHAKPAYEDEQRIIKTGKPIIDLVEKEVKKDGSVSWVSTTKMPLKDKNGKIVGTFGISKNVTRIKNLELEAEEKEKELKKLQEKIRRLEGK